MDLAKIRKKYRQKPISVPDAKLQPDNQAAFQLPEPSAAASVSSESGLINEIIPGNAHKVPAAPHIPERATAFRNPIEIIMAGRRAAGCDEEAADDEELSPATSVSSLEYLCFRVSDEIYGINIIDIKEIIKPREVTEIPCAPKFVSGIISLRGTIIPIIDMRSRLGLSCEKNSGKERVVVIKNNQSFSGLLVDEVIQVVRVNRDNIEPAPSVLEGIDRDFVSGIGRSEGRLIIILNIGNIADIHLF